MANNHPKCQGCAYNTPKSRGGYGRDCNGYTQDEFGRCPEWRLNEFTTNGGKTAVLAKEAAMMGR